MPQKNEMKDSILKGITSRFCRLLFEADEELAGLCYRAELLVFYTVTIRVNIFIFLLLEQNLEILVSLELSV